MCMNVQSNINYSYPILLRIETLSIKSQYLFTYYKPFNRVDGYCIFQINPFYVDHKKSLPMNVNFQCRIFKFLQSKQLLNCL